MADHVTNQHSQDQSFSYAAVRSLTLDQRLSPLDRNCWYVMHMLRSTGGLYPMTGMGQLRSYLTSTRCGKRAAYATAWRAVTVLRLTGWISSVGHYSDPLTGKVNSELYRVNERALDFHEASALDPSLRELLDSCCNHESNQVSILAELILRTLTQPAESDPISIQDQYNDDDDLSPPSPPSEECTAALPPSSPCNAENSTTVMQQTEHPQVRPCEPASTYTTYSYSKERTYRANTPKQSELQSVSEALPPCLTSAKADQQRDILTALKRLPSQQRQDVLDELQARSQGGTVRNVVAYFFALVRRVSAGEFRLWAGRQQAHPVKKAASPRVATSTHTEVRKKPIERGASSEVGHPHIANMRKILASSTSAGQLAKGVLEARGWRDCSA